MAATLFSAEDRERVQRRVLELAEQDDRVVAGAVVGSLAVGEGDRWSDLDLSFGVADGVEPTEVLEDWTCTVTGELDGVFLFDIWSGETIYRVFLLPGCLQFDLSFSPAASFGAGAPTFRLLFGTGVEKPSPAPPDPRELFGHAVHHALRARVCIERGEPWQAEFWVSAVRDYALSLACIRYGLPPRYGKGYDRLPAEVLEPFAAALPTSLEPAELRRALGAAIEALLREPGDVAAKLEPQLRALAAR